MQNKNNVKLDSYGNLNHISQALSAGGKLHAFRSGGGLRVLRVEDQLGALIGYGEHSNASGAFRILADDIQAGCRPYSAVYGPVEAHYYTGSTTPEDVIDHWLLKGYTFDIIANKRGGCMILFEGFMQHKAPKWVHSVTMKGATRRYKDARGFEYETGPFFFPNGERGITTRVISRPIDKDWQDDWMWEEKDVWAALSLSELLTHTCWVDNKILNYI